MKIILKWFKHRSRWDAPMSIHHDPAPAWGRFVSVSLSPIEDVSWISEIVDVAEIPDFGHSHLHCVENTVREWAARNRLDWSTRGAIPDDWAVLDTQE